MHTVGGEEVKRSISEAVVLTGGTHSEKFWWIYCFVDSKDISALQPSELLNSCLHG